VWGLVLVAAFFAASCGGGESGPFGNPPDAPVEVVVTEEVPYLTDAEVFTWWAGIEAAAVEFNFTQAVVQPDARARGHFPGAVA
jgi:hypothetical protein